MKEYMIEAYKRKPNTDKMDWFKAAYPCSQRVVPTWYTLEDAQNSLEVVRNAWQKIRDEQSWAAANYVIKYAPVKFRIVSREVSEWEPVKEAEYEGSL
jgi:hypothetical protein